MLRLIVQIQTSNFIIIFRQWYKPLCFSFNKSICNFLIDGNGGDTFLNWRIKSYECWKIPRPEGLTIQRIPAMKKIQHSRKYTLLVENIPNKAYLLLAELKQRIFYQISFSLIKFKYLLLQWHNFKWVYLFRTLS